MGNHWSNVFVIFRDLTDSNMTYLEFLSSVTTELIQQEGTTKQKVPSTNSSKNGINPKKEKSRTKP